ncbi:MAG: hypothetical protein EZS28_003637 [Streblomastix strix]|uniref:Uncharacterized protein n=1 Tax=Streblomastix strix TaxID=222440 RepID=A0A5J4X105_9EUKA|nr:MAG: hypothetical protein EZS28_003637 [Streblomastix strix]
MPDKSQQSKLSIHKVFLFWTGLLCVAFIAVFVFGIVGILSMEILANIAIFVLILGLGGIGVSLIGFIAGFKKEITRKRRA